MALDKDLLDKLIEEYQKPEDLIGENGLLKQLTKGLVERAMNAELTHHLGYEKNDPQGRGERQFPKRKESEEAEGRLWRDRGRSSSRSRRRVRAENRTQTPTTVRRFRRQDSVDVCAWDEYAGDPGTLGGDLWRRD